MRAVKLLDLSWLGDAMCREQRACRYYGTGGMVSRNVFRPLASPGMKLKQKWALQKEACIGGWEWFTWEVVNVQRNYCIGRFSSLRGKKSCTDKNCMCISCDGLAVFISWDSVIWEGGGKKLCLWCGCMCKFISLQKYPTLMGNWISYLRRNTDLSRVSVCWPLAGAVIWRGAALPCQARLEGSYLLPSASIIALVILPRMWIFTQLSMLSSRHQNINYNAVKINWNTA